MDKIAEILKDCPNRLRCRAIRSRAAGNDLRSAVAPRNGWLNELRARRVIYGIRGKGLCEGRPLCL